MTRISFCWFCTWWPFYQEQPHVPSPPLHLIPLHSSVFCTKVSFPGGASFLWFPYPRSSPSPDIVLTTSTFPCGLRSWYFQPLALCPAPSGHSVSIHRVDGCLNITLYHTDSSHCTNQCSNPASSFPPCWRASPSLWPSEKRKITRLASWDSMSAMKPPRSSDSLVTVCALGHLALLLFRGWSQKRPTLLDHLFSIHRNLGNANLNRE